MINKRMFLSIISFSIIGSFTNYALSNDKAIILYENLEGAQVLSQKEDKPLLVIFSGENCVFCNLLKKEVLSDNLTSKYIVCVLNIKQNKSVSRKMNIKMLPTSIVLDKELEEVNRITGYDKKSYTEWLEKNHE